MREIKFRAWDISKQEMRLSPDDIRHLGSWFDAHLPGALSDLDNIVIMQYTGLKDKNGVEIYEGDICRVTHNEGISWEKTYTDTGSVEFSKGGFAVKCLHPGRSNAKDESRRYFYLNFSDKRQFEVIGNIYATPSLLK